jgi:hypothetical protein
MVKTFLKRSYLFMTIIGVLTLTGCGHSGQISVPSGSNAQTSSRAPKSGPQFQPTVSNLFASARGLALSDADLDKYITAPLSATDRALAHQYMAMMPMNLRGDFAFIDTQHGNRVISNNATLVNSVVVTTSSGPPVSSTSPPAVGGAPSGTTMSLLRSSSGVSRSVTSEQRSPSAVRRAMDYSPPCSGPPNPPSAANGLYVRYVSKCGFTTGWAFLYIEPYSSSMAEDQNGNQLDDGYAYFETAGESGSLLEGGYAYYNDTSIAGYGKVYNYSTKQTTNFSLNNQSYRYTAGQILTVFTGLTDNQQAGYSLFGQLPSNQDPRTVWISDQVVYPVNPVWLFFTVPSDFWDKMTPNAAGWTTPCKNCTVSKVTSIGQSGAGCQQWCEDESFFGIDPNGYNAINWVQLAFGTWESECVSGVSVCYFDTSNDPTVYAGGPQYYPDSTYSQQNVGPTGYGPYESFDGIDAGGYYGYDNAARNPEGTFSEPLPPPPCTIDSNGYCAINTENTGTAYCTSIHIVHGLPVQYQEPYTTTMVYVTYNSSGSQVGVSVETITKGNNYCTPVTTNWSPGEPKVLYNDPNLP